VIIGLDIGTSVTKASAIFRDGTVGATASVPTTLIRHPGGRVEQDLEDVLVAVAAVVREIVDSATEPIEALAVTGQGDGLWLRDSTGVLVRPAISWLDGRASQILEQWGEGGDDSVLHRIYALTGSGVFPGCHAALLSWMSENEPESLTRATVAGYCVDAVIQNLTGTVTVDASDASLPFLNVTTREYVTEALALCGVAGWRHLLAPPAAPGTVFALDDRGSGLLGLPVGTAVTGGPYDLEACGFGAGTLREGEGTLIVGTTLSCQVLTTDVAIALTDEPAGMWLCTPDPGMYLRVMPSMVGTASIDWMLGLFGLDASDLDSLLKQSPPGASGARMLSFLAPSGERAPFVDPRARGQLTGLQLQHTRADLVRALCESLAFAARHCFEAMNLTGELAACGGGLQSDEWASIFADVLGRSILLPHSSAVGSVGAARTAWSALGDPVDDDLWRSRRRRVDPDPARVAFYQDAYVAYGADLAAARSRW